MQAGTHACIIILHPLLSFVRLCVLKTSNRQNVCAYLSYNNERSKHIHLNNLSFPSFLLHCQTFQKRQ